MTIGRSFVGGLLRRGRRFEPLFFVPRDVRQHGSQPVVYLAGNNANVQIEPPAGTLAAP
jgi:hypothetical protein